MAKFHTFVTVVIEVDAPDKKAGRLALLRAKADLQAVMPTSVGQWGVTSHGLVNEGEYDPIGRTAQVLV